MMYQGRDIVLRCTRVGMQFYDVPGSGCSFTMYPGLDAVLRCTRVGIQFYDVPDSGCSFTM